MPEAHSTRARSSGRAGRRASRVRGTRARSGCATARSCTAPQPSPSPPTNRESEMARSSSARADRDDRSAERSGDASVFVPDSRAVSDLASAVQACTACPLYIDTTQAVFGKGSRRPRLILVGEQPGDVEDRKGIPFVGPAGRVLWECIEAAGIDRGKLYATNAVKHFKHEDRGKRRLHKKPSTDEIEACHPWLDAELEAFPKVDVVALGATAARSLLGKPVTISAGRLAPTVDGSRTVFVTYHPS